MKKIDDEFLYEEIKKLENSYIESLPKDDELNHNFSSEFEDNINWLLEKNKLEGKKVKTKHVCFQDKLMPTLAAILIIAIFFVAPIFNSEKQMFFDFLNTNFSKFSSIFSPGKTSSHIEDKNEDWIAIEPSYIPKEFKLKKNILTKYSFESSYVNDKNEEIFYYTCSLSYDSKFVLPENTSYEKVGIENITVYKEYKNGKNTLFWKDGKNAYTISSSIDLIELMKIAKSIIID